MAADDRFPVFNPATGEVLAEAPNASPVQTDEAIGLARLAQKKWASDETDRRRVLLDCSRAIDRHLEELASLITLEQGKPISQAYSEVHYAALQFAQAANMDLDARVLADISEVRTVLHYKPLGVVGLITPWNYPLGTAAVKLAPALRIGNTVVLKPSPLAPLSALRLGELLGDILPAGILSVLSGQDDVGELLSKHPDIAKISLTGSNATGKSVMRNASSDLKRLTLELGGNDPAIVLPDANPKAVCDPIIAAAFRNAGQVCSAIKRVYVPANLEKDLIELMTAAIRRQIVGSGLDPATTMGPLTCPTQRRRICRMAQEAELEGGVERTGGQALPATGSFLAPSLFTGVGSGCRLVDEEQFGPVLPIITYRKIEEAIAQANASPFGLSASVWTENRKRGYEIAAEIEAGRVGVNGHSRAETPAPFGGFKQSGLGRELGIWGLMGMSEMQVVNVFRGEVSL